MAISLPDQESIAESWLCAASYLEEHRSVYDLVFTTKNPQLNKPSDIEIINVHDGFLRKHDSSVATVANTIFPSRIYKKFGHPDFFQHASDVQSRLKYPGAWGNYFQRLCDGKNSGEIPLETIVSKMTKQLKSSSTFGNVYEWSAPLYDPSLDCNRILPQPCMSHISFKLVDKKLLRLSVMYRSHYYISKLLGNLVGLRDLQAFICKEVGIEMGPLTIFSSYAKFDTGKKWTLLQAKQMLVSCRVARDQVLDDSSVHFDKN